MRRDPEFRISVSMGGQRDFFNNSLPWRYGTKITHWRLFTGSDKVSIKTPCI